ncbi:gamma-glutamyltransferase Ecym_3092 [Eremothecium cymbalariae DBVPG|uniref:Glutathione hydrolase n=1 Tax=Eremothecium cymbalariae (strain CBS 270.75 / DBVPG 7215 / KCTC 17166 / NRRL Y-17582) TaxID=931890 RepID=G8JR32_ERECY|nr:Hypothetical protein Ecym_3092 [Eremothecium cymbalariae DBVPG\
MNRISLPMVLFDRQELSSWLMVATVTNKIQSLLVVSLFLTLCSGIIIQNPVTGALVRESHNIDIGYLNRSATLNPEHHFLKIGHNGGISSDLELCNRMAVHDVLLGIPGSNAADAAVTTCLCIGMINFFNSGIGGGGYAVYTDGLRPSRHLAFDFREAAPELAHRDMYEHDESLSKLGGLAIGVPGELAGLYELYERRGSGVAKWADLLRPVIELGFDGWSIGPALAATLKEYEAFFKQHRNDWGFVFHKTENRVLGLGEWISRPALAKTLETLASSGNVAPFYEPNSHLVSSMVNKIQSSQGIITESDFAKYSVDVTTPLKLKIRKGWQYLPNNDLTVLTSGGSSSGAALLSALKIMDNFESSEGGDLHLKESYQLVEAMKWMASARSRLGDFGGGEEIPPQVKDILSDKWSDYAASLIKDGYLENGYGTLTKWADYLPLYEINEPHGTAHFSIVDHKNNAVSFTTTINLLFGSLIHDPGTGIVFNNQMDDFSQPGRTNSFGLSPSPYNYIEPFKRPLSSTAPTVVLNELGLPDMIVGASGGSRITTAILQVIIRSYWYHMPILETIAYPRIHHQLLPEVLQVESLSMIGNNTITELRRMGHKTIEATPKSVVNAVKNWHGVWHAVSDYWRKRGVSVAY